MDVVWRFMAGLTGFRSTGWKVVMARRGRNDFKFVLPFLDHSLRFSSTELDSRVKWF